jgi:zinc D-Ala-D-Ala carboxypeptidase
MKFKHFNYDEFDSPLQEGSGQLMQDSFLEKLDRARDIAGIPFRITSGFRIEADIERLQRKGYKVSKKSSHLKGCAADIGTPSSEHRYRIINALLEAGFNRIGIAESFVHVDSDPDKPAEVIWTY